MNDTDTLLKPAHALLARLRRVGVEAVTFDVDGAIKVRLTAEDRRLLSPCLLGEAQALEKDLVAVLTGCCAPHDGGATVGIYRCQAPVMVRAYWGDWFCEHCAMLVAEHLEDRDAWPPVTVPDFPVAA